MEVGIILGGIFGIIIIAAALIASLKDY